MQDDEDMREDPPQMDPTPPQTSRPTTPRPPSSPPHPPTPPPPSPPSDPPSDFDRSNDSGRNTPPADDYPPTTQSKIQISLDFIWMIKESTLMSQFEPEELADLLDPQEHKSTPLDDPVLKLSLLNFILFMGASQVIYKAAQHNLHKLYPDITILSYFQAEQLLAYDIHGYKILLSYNFSSSYTPICLLHFLNHAGNKPETDIDCVYGQDK